MQPALNARLQPQTAWSRESALSKLWRK